MREAAPLDCDVPRRETQGEFLQEQVNEGTDVDPTVEGVGLLRGAGCVGDEAPSICIGEGGFVVSSWVEILKILENVVEVGLARGAHGIAEADGLGWEVDCDEDPVHAVHIDWEEQVAQSKDVYFLGPLAHSFEVIGVGRGLVGEHGCSNLKQPGVELRSETVAALAIKHEGSAVVQVTVDEQGSAGMNARIIQPLSWPEAAEAAHRHRRGQVTGDPVLVGVGRGWGAVGQDGCDSFLGCWAQHSQRRVLEERVGGGVGFGLGH